MRGKRVKELFQKTSTRVGAAAIAAVVIGSGIWATTRQATYVPELTSFVDVAESVEIVEDEVPLASAPKVTKTTKTKKTTKKVKLKKKSTRTYTKKSAVKTKTNTAKKTTSAATTTTQTVTQTSMASNFKKGSNINTQVTTVKTTVTTTVVAKQAASTTPVVTAQSSNTFSGEMSIEQAAPKVDARVKKSFTALNFKIVGNAGVSYSGLFDARTQSITLKKLDDTVYHELGHYVAFIAGNVDTTSAFQQIFNEEKSSYTAFNKVYVLSNSSEYFAESFKNYTLDPAALKASRPKTYAAIEEALSRITDAQVAKVKAVYGSIWS